MILTASISVEIFAFLLTRDHDTLRMMITMIAAMAHNNVIADESGIPWQGHLPRDVAYFRETTMGSTIIMGAGVYKEFEKPLSGRNNIVVTHATELREGFVAAHSIEEALDLTHDEDCYIIGGGSIYAQCMKFADRLLITNVHASFEGSVFFPKINVLQWKEANRICHAADSDNAYDLCFITYLRQNAKSDV